MITTTLKNESTGKKHTIKIGKRYSGEKYRPGGLICDVAPWESSGCPITLDICICPDGEILIRGWEWAGDGNAYLHAFSKPENVEVTDAMIDTVSGLWSGRILVDGVRINVGASVQRICPINMEKEEELLKKKIYLA